MGVTDFVGRSGELDRLAGLLDEVRQGTGVMVAVRGRRQVGKSRLVGEFVERAGVPAVFFTASGQPPAVELAAFLDAARAGGVVPVDVPAGAVASWEAALLLATADAVPDAPVIVVIDELPYLANGEPAIEGVLQRAWRTLERRPVMLVLVGSDISMMESLTAYRRPLYGRAREMPVQPLSVADVAEMRGLSAQAAMDAYLVTGGFPRLAARWRSRDTVGSFLRRELADEASPLVVTGERMLTGELPADLNARAVLTAIGAGERAHGAIAGRSGVGRGTFEKALAALGEKRMVDRVTPYAEPASGKLPRYVVSDPYLRFWLRFVGPSIDLIARGRPDMAIARIEDGWSSYRGRAIEPLVRASMERLLPDPRFGDARFVGAFWTKDNRTEVDLVGGRDVGRAGTVEFIGSVKWRDREPFARDDLAALQEARSRVPGATPRTRLVAVTRAGADVDGLDVVLGPDDLVAAWRPGSAAT